ncbi:CGEA protein [Bacillus cereus group sp. BfR-BA-01380]|uniref:CGEA protein n=1 Tax=Bacillus cereus group sp. BfR-BA-01380 TaxID=2920324 RepID=UPI001F5917A9|nr:CGEA protein [Bacillus cereus group sp. BfR-BA-01380]
MAQICDGSACFVFSSILPGTVVTIVGKSGHMYGPATFAFFNSENCVVTLLEEDMTTPSYPIVLQIGCNDIESVSYTPGGSGGGGDRPSTSPLILTKHDDRL